MWDHSFMLKSYGVGRGGVVAYEILVSAQGPLVFGFWVWGFGPGLDKNAVNLGQWDKPVNKFMLVKYKDLNLIFGTLELVYGLLGFFYGFGMSQGCNLDYSLFFTGIWHIQYHLQRCSPFPKKQLQNVFNVMLRGTAGPPCSMSWGSTVSSKGSPDSRRP